MLYNEDCLEALKQIANESIDLVITDPPYRVTSKGCTGTMSGYWTSKLSKQGKIFNHNDIKCIDYLSEFARVLKDGTHAYVMCNNINLAEMIDTGNKCGLHFVKALIWDKCKKICGRYYMNCFEYILLFRKGKDRAINHCGTGDILRVPINKLKDKDGHNLHDTEKPVELMKILIDNSSNENDTVLDCFMGIGSTGVACKELHRNFIGMEIDKKYFDVAKERIENGDT